MLLLHQKIFPRNDDNKYRMNKDYTLSLILIFIYGFIVTSIFQMEVVIKNVNIIKVFIFIIYPAITIIIVCCNFENVHNTHKLKVIITILTKLIFDPSYLNTAFNSYPRQCCLISLSDSIYLTAKDAKFSYNYLKLMEYRPCDIHEFRESPIHQFIHLLTVILVTLIFLIILCLQFAVFWIIALITPIISIICLLRNKYWRTAVAYQFLWIIWYIFYQFFNNENVIGYYLGIIYIITFCSKEKLNANTKMFRLLSICINELCIFGILSLSQQIFGDDKEIRHFIIFSYAIINGIIGKYYMKVHNKQFADLYIKTALWMKWYVYGVSLCRLIIIDANSLIYVYGIGCYCCIVIMHGYWLENQKNHISVNLWHSISMILWIFVILISIDLKSLNTMTTITMAILTLFIFCFQIITPFPICNPQKMQEYIQWTKKSMIYNFAIVNKSKALSLENVIGKYYCCIHCIHCHKHETCHVSRNRLMCCGKAITLHSKQRKALKRHNLNSMQCIRDICKFYKLSIDEKWNMVSNIQSNMNQWIFLCELCLSYSYPVIWCLIVWILSIDVYYGWVYCGLLMMYLIVIVMWLWQIRNDVGIIPVKVLIVMMNWKELEEQLTSEILTLTNVSRMYQDLPAINLIVDAFPMDVAVIIVSYFHSTQVTFDQV